MGAMMASAASTEYREHRNTVQCPDGCMMVGCSCYTPWAQCEKSFIQCVPDKC